MGIRFSVNEVFFDRWSNEMAYVLGFLYADGSMEDAPRIRGRYVRVTNTDKDRIITIKRLLGSRHTITKDHTDRGHKTRYLLRIGNQSLYDRLVVLGLTPRKSLTMLFPTVPRKYLGTFTRGYFDGDGCVHLEMNVSGTPKKLLTAFTSGSKAFLIRLHELLRAEIGIIGPGLYAHGSAKGIYQLRYSSADSVRLFKLMYALPMERGLFLRRKYAIFTRYFRLHAASKRSRLKFDGLVVKK